MADGFYPSLVSANRDPNAQDNVIHVQLSDGSASLTSTSGSLNVNLTNTSIVVTATDLDIRDLSHTQDSVKVGDGTDFLAVNADGSINVTDNGGSLTVDGTVELGATTLAALESITVQNPGGAGAVNIQDGGNSITVDATDLDIRNLDHSQDNVLIYGNDGTTDRKILTDADGTVRTNLAKHELTSANALPVSKDNDPNSESNPIFVQTVNTAVSGNEVQDYNVATANANSIDNHDYTVTGTTFLLKSIIVAGSGNVKFEVQVGPLASLATKAVGFLTGREGDTKQLFFDPAIEVPATGTGTIRVIRTNRQNQAVDVYSTIIGNDIA